MKTYLDVLLDVVEVDPVHGVAGTVDVRVGRPKDIFKDHGGGVSRSVGTRAV